MAKINEILSLDLQENIKSVIDLEDRSEFEIQQEIESYIVTEGIGQHLYDFTNQFNSKVKETGVWISGFYGSGKSYFGKMLGYIIANPTINGTPARERFIPRLKGVSNESLIENSIRKLDTIKSCVVFLDIAKQNTDHGLAFTLFANLLKNLGFRDDIYGYMEFDLYTEGKYGEFKNIAKKIGGDEWSELKKSNRRVAKLMRRIFSEMGYSEAEYTETYNVYSSAINNFSASKFKDELEKYLSYKPDETLIFIFDEASEAITQKKFTLLDLEGISEALSSVSSKVWTIAIAQEKLDDVINNSNVTRSQLTKVTDRFRTKIHLESTEVDVIIRSRLLHKKEPCFQQLLDYYKENESLVDDITNLKSAFPTRTTTAKDFAIYYPFHKYQFDILQKFLFSSNALVTTQIAARGMIITTFDVLKKQMRDRDLYAFTPGYAICSEAQIAPPPSLVSKYDTALKILKEQDSPLNGEELLKTIHLLADSEVVSPTVENITKSYISYITDYYKTKPKIEEALSLLVEAKVLLLSNNNYKITSDLEGKLLEEMKDFDVEFFNKKRSLINYIKKCGIFTSVITLTDGNDSFKFSILSDQDDELTNSGNRELKLTVYSLFNISEDRQDFIEQIKLKTQHNKDLITLIPDNTDFSHIDKLIDEISRYSYMEEKYANEPDQTKRQIIREFSIIREEKEKELRILIENAYKKASLVYMFAEDLMYPDTFKAIINETQRKLVKNIYTKRLPAQLSESLTSKVFGNRKENLSSLFSGEDFKFFDGHGNYIGDNLKVVEELSAKINSRYVDGKTLEADLSGAPWGYSFGTIVTTLAVLFRSGKLSVKYNGETWHSHEQTGVHEAFTNATRFRSASFKSITRTLTATQKNTAVQLLLDLDIHQHTGHKLDWNVNDFDLAGSIRVMADHFIGALTTLNDTVENFDALFLSVAEQKSILQNYSGKITESNYIERVEHLLSTRDQFRSAIQTILTTQKFIKKDFSQLKDLKKFVEAVNGELKKAGRPDTIIQAAYDEFISLYNQDMVNNFGPLRKQAQIAKDTYFLLIKNASADMTRQYQMINGKVDAAIQDLSQNYPAELNTHNYTKLEELKCYCTNRIIKGPTLEYSTTCKNCGYSLTDILNYTYLAPTKEAELQIIQTGFVSEMPPSEPKNGDSNESSAVKKPRRVKLLVPSNIMTVQDYKSLLTGQLTLLASERPEEMIELKIDFKIKECRYE